MVDRFRAGLRGCTRLTMGINMGMRGKRALMVGAALSTTRLIHAVIGGTCRTKTRGMIIG